YNEKATLLALLEKVRAVPLEKEIIVVDDGSTDGTRELLKELEKKSSADLVFVYQGRNRGKGAAIRRGMEKVTGEVVVIQDADLEYEPMDLVRLIQPIIRGEARVVYGSRVLGRNPKSSFSFYLGGRFLSWLTNLLYGTSLTDEPTCYKMFRTEVLRSLSLKCRGFEFCPEVTAKVSRQGVKIVELPIRYYPRTLEQGKKISWRDGLVAIWTLIRYRFNR
ncbi:MAG TPA: glycosyltransferase family 2 protein, partial [bacterium]|nr:glycosyltransferase family 2 protein [bacterium]